MTATTEVLTLGDVVDAGLPEGMGVQLRTKTGKWSKVYGFVGSMWRERSNTYTFVTVEDRPAGMDYEKGRRYLDAETEVRIVPR